MSHFLHVVRVKKPAVMRESHASRQKPIPRATAYPPPPSKAGWSPAINQRAQAVLVDSVSHEARDPLVTELSDDVSPENNLSSIEMLCQFSRLRIVVNTLGSDSAVGQALNKELTPARKTSLSPQASRSSTRT